VQRFVLICDHFQVVAFIGENLSLTLFEPHTIFVLMEDKVVTQND
jgi:hypothetical protein